MREEEYIFCDIADERMGKKNILIVDDDVEMLKIFRFYLQDAYNVTVVNSGKAAMKLMEDYEPELVLLDYLMPGCNGADVFKYMKESDVLVTVPVMFLTGVTDEKTIRECMSYHPADYIVKPIAKQALLTKLESFFNKR